MPGNRNPRLPRPKTIQKFLLANSTWYSTDNKPNTTISSKLEALSRQLFLADAIVRRNKNQHRAQRFFKYLCLLRTSLRRLHGNLSRQDKLSNEGIANGANSIRDRFQLEARLRTKEDALREHIKEKLVPSCYVSFSNVVADSQFANLGIVLMGLLAEVVSISGLMEQIDAASETAMNHYETGPGTNDGSGVDVGVKIERRDVAILLGSSTRATGENKGEVVERIYESDGDVHLTEKHVESGRSVDTHSPEMKPDSQEHEDDMVQVSKQGSPLRLTASAPVHDAISTKKKQKKVKKQKNVLDDLFSSLL